MSREKYYGDNQTLSDKPTRWSMYVAAVMLWLLVMMSALAVVYSTHEARRTTDELQALHREESRLRVVSGQYQLEESTWAAYARVEKLATEQLGMTIPLADSVVMVRQNP